MCDITYPIIITKEENLLYITIPEFTFDSYSLYATNLSEAIKTAKEFLTLEIMDYENNNLSLPTFNEENILNLKSNLDTNQELFFINFWLPYEKSLIKETYKKKTLSIPTWLDILATQKNLNFSQVLQKALKKELNLE